MDDRDNVSISYTVKELLGRIDLKIDRLTEAVDHRFDDHEARIRKLEQSAVTEDALEVARRSNKGSMYKAVGAATALLSMVIAAANQFL
jgi:hypothetical protein